MSDATEPVLRDLTLASLDPERIGVELNKLFSKSEELMLVITLIKPKRCNF